MLSKLIKHELRATARVMLPLLAAVVSATLLTTIFNAFTRHGNSGLTAALVKFCVGLLIVTIIAVCVMCLVVAVYRFYRNLLRDEGYLMMSLPATPYALVFSKLLVSAVWFVLSGIVIVLCILSFSLGASDHLRLLDLVRAIPEFAEDLREALSGTEISLVHIPVYFLEGLLLFVVFVWGLCLRFYAAMSLGHCFHSSRGLLSVVFYFALAWVFRIAMILFFVFLNKLDTMGISWSFGFSAATFAQAAWAVHGVFWILIGLTLVYDAILYFVSILGLKRHLNLA